MLCNEAYRFSNSAEQAASIASQLVLMKRGSNGIEATQAAARECSIGLPILKRLLQPSRRPKRVSWEILHSLRGAYLRVLRREVERMSTEIVRMEAMGFSDNAAIQNLADEARMVLAQIESLGQSDGRR